MNSSQNESQNRCEDCVVNFTLTEEGVLDYYEQTWSKTYDNDLVSLKSRYHDQLVQTLCELIPEESRGEIQILDIAAGTGLVGQGLQKAGFKLFDAVDMSSAMLDQLRSRHLYRHVTCARVGGGHTLTKIGDGTYDVITIAGGFAHAHLPVDSLREVSRLLKPGGYFLNIMTEKYLEVVDALKEFEPLMKTLETKGVWQILKRQTYPELSVGRKAVMHVVRKM